jgi:CobQ-like glutamine amidotransferase family enzyme
MINLGAFFPERLNLNGDQGNLLALARYLEAAGFEVSVHSVGAANSYSDIHFGLLGHGSIAAVESLQVQLAAVDFDELLAKIPGLAVGSGFEYLSERGITKSIITRGDRESEFVTGSLGSLKALGYRNTDSGLPDLELNSNWICSMLHGPVLAKNPQLLHRAAKAAVACAGLVWPSEPPIALVAWVKTLNDVCAKIWTLESEEAFPALTNLG